MKKIFSKNLMYAWIMVAVSIAVAVIGIFIMPDIIPTHFGADGTPDDWGSKYFIFLYPGVLVLVTALAEPLKKIDPKVKSYARFDKYYYYFFVGFAVFFLALETANIFIALGVDINVGNITCFLLGLFFVFLGNMLPKIKQNFQFGIKTPWAVADEENWYKTHRMGGKLFFISGVITMMLAFVQGEAKAWIFLAVILIVTLGLYAYSAMIHIRKQNKNL